MPELKEWAGDCELRGNLFQQDFSSILFRNVSFEGANLEETKFSHSTFIDCNFTGAKLARAKFDHAKFVFPTLADSTFFRADLYATFWEGKVSGPANFEESLLFSSHFTNVTWEKGTRFWRSNLQCIEAENAQLVEADFRCAILRNANLCNANLEDANFENADLMDANLSRARLSGAQFAFTLGYPSPYKFLKDNFKFDARGIIVYTTKTLSKEEFDFRPGLVLRAQVNRDPSANHGSGIQFGPLERIQSQTKELVYQARILYPQLANVVIPYQSFWPRTSQLTLIREIKEKNG